MLISKSIESKISESLWCFIDLTDTQAVDFDTAINNDTPFALVDNFGNLKFVDSQSIRTVFPGTKTSMQNYQCYV